MPKLGAVLFDYNGTILDDVTQVYEIVQEVFRQYKLPCPTWEQYQSKCVRYVEFFKDHGVPCENTQELKERIDNIRFNYIWTHSSHVSFRPGLLEVLRMLEPIKTGIVSGENKFLLEEGLKRAGLTKFFKHVRGQAWPDKRPALLEACEALGCIPEEAMYVDDTYEGLKAAKDVGMRAVAFVGGYNSIERLLDAKPNYIIDYLMGLKEIFLVGGFEYKEYNG